jgi:hypothetical protein
MTVNRETGPAVSIKSLKARNLFNSDVYEVNWQNDVSSPAVTLKCDNVTLAEAVLACRARVASCGVHIVSRERRVESSAQPLA